MATVHKNSRREYVRLSVRFSALDYAKLKARQKLAEYPTFTKFLRDMAMSGGIRKVDTSHAKENVRLIKNIANNINQIAKRVNSTSEFFQEDVAVLKGYLEQVLDKATEISEGVNALK
ncbi:MAG: MobC family plasmid mobilization relaxosome protein [Defluviitaleaceae bacterium]|nr:MobC family plasmid mobilization relaxosome protein [Defluviitaleaceae bacterium]